METVSGKLETTSTDTGLLKAIAINQVRNDPLPALTVAVSSSQNSAAFELQGRLNFAHIGTTGSERTLTLQYTTDGGSSWFSTGVTVTTATGSATIINADSLAVIAPLCGGGAIFRLDLGASDSITTIWYSSN